MKLESVEIDNYRAIEHLHLPLDPSLTVLHGGNTCGKTSVLSAIAVGLGAIPDLLPGVSGIDYLGTDLREGESFVRVDLTAADGLSWKRERLVREYLPPGPPPDPRLADMRERFVQEDLETPETTTCGLDALKGRLSGLVVAARKANLAVELPIVAFYDTDRAVLDGSGHGAASRLRSYAARAVQEERFLSHGFRTDYSSRYAALNGALEAHIDFSDLFTWFYARENDELREQKKRNDFSYCLNDLSAVRLAIESMLDGVSDARVETEPLRVSRCP